MSTTRVLQVLGCLDRGGAENMIMSIYRNIDREKYQFDFVVHLKKHADFDEEVKALGGRIYYAPRYDGRNHFEYKNWWTYFFKAHPEYKLLHSHIRSTATLITEIAKKYGVKTIVHSHSTMTAGSGLSAFVKDIMQKNITRNADKCLACSDAAGEWLFKKHSFTVLPNAIDAKLFVFNEENRKKIREKYNLADSFVVGHVGRFHKIKNQTFLMEIFKEILKTKPDAKLLLVGEKIGSEGMDKQELVAFAENLGIIDNVIFAGNVSNVNEYLSAFDTFVFPSLYEGLGVCMIEAQASGLHCFISDSVSTESKITDNVEFISLKKSPDEWAERVTSFDYPERRNYYQDIYDAGYDIEAGVKRLEEIYYSLLSK
ncbi:MAG: glycosyltransferase family 1 protein [Clostridia bacterium]|nr:glycosyltransferase family 1 protein [Clostridia bacterium]